MPASSPGHRGAPLLITAELPPDVFAWADALRRRHYPPERNVLDAQPNPAHAALAKLDREWDGELLIVTQNIDDLHERAGAQRVLHMHGEALLVWCRACDARHPWEGTLLDGPPCPACGAVALRPDIVWFGEMPYQMDRIFAAIARADLFVSIGTSGAVYPAAGFVQQAAAAQARTLELNLERSNGSHWFDETRLGPASVLADARGKVISMPMPGKRSGATRGCAAGRAVRAT